MRIRALVVACTSIFIGAGMRGSAPADPVLARDTHENLHAVLWMQTSAEYQAIARGLYRLAAEQVDRALQDPRWTAVPEQAWRPDLPSLAPAVILDVDETTLDNSPEEAQAVIDLVPPDPGRFPAWVQRAEAAFVPGAREFLQYARDVKVDIYFVTNRPVSLEDATIVNLRRQGLDVAPDHVLCLGENEWNADKSARRQSVAERHRVLLLVGDDLGDFVSVTTGGPDGGLQLLPPDARRALIDRYSGYWEDRWMVLPNPAYGSWERALHASGLSDADALRAKREALKGTR
jgi:5'-nucleotidase (lipoprotein e(P4) family)